MAGKCRAQEAGNSVAMVLPSEFSFRTGAPAVFESRLRRTRYSEDQNMPHESFVIRFFATWDGRVHCRITDVQTNQSWVLKNAAELRAIIQNPPREPAGG